MFSLKYIKTFFKDPYVASIGPSSPLLIRQVCKTINFNKKNRIVEYGPGTGAFTKYLLKRISPDSELIIIETNPHFITELLKIKDSRLHIFHACASNIDQIHQKTGSQPINYIISGIPFSFFDHNFKKKLLEKTKACLSPEGQFIVYQCSSHIERYLHMYFPRIEKRYGYNIPILTIYRNYLK